MGDRTTTSTVPHPLVEGQQLDQPTFHAIYEAMPPGTRAELIDGVVYMPSPVGSEHGRAQVPVIMWLGHFAAFTPGVSAMDSATIILSWKSEPQPDALLRVRSKFGGRSRDEGGYIHGAPELVAEVSKATRYVDLGPKLRDYERAGVLEYVVRAIDPDEIYWFAQQNGVLVQRAIGDDGFYRSTAFPGLWLDPVALLDGDTRRLQAVVEMVCSTTEHAEFVARLEKARDQPAS
jgi:Uma2 family endonuclease